MTTKTNTDYTASAVNLHLALPEVEEELAKLKEAETNLAIVKKEIEDNTPVELLAEELAMELNVKTQREIVINLIDAKGSFQDIENGAYAVKQLKQSWEYNPEPILNATPDSTFGKVKYMVIRQTVDVTALNGLIKGKILDEQDLKDNGVIVPGKQTYSYIIKTGGEK